MIGPRGESRVYANHMRRIPIALLVVWTVLVAAIAWRLFFLSYG
jgi:hypothetical protein